jgi:hypothetical protein
LSQLGAPQKFKKIEIPLKKGLKNLKIIFENFNKMLYGSHFPFRKFYSELFSNLENSEFSLRKS